MKRYIILPICVCLAFLPAFSQISINTRDAQGIFYIDAAADNTTTSPDRFANDVMVDTEGSLVLAPTSATGKAKVDITSSERYGALRIQDGNQGEGMVLMGDKDGYASWGMMKGSGGYMLSVVAPATVLNTRTNYPLWFTDSSNSISIKDEGNYIIMVRSAITYMGTPNRMSGYVYLCKNAPDPDTSVIDTYEFYSQVVNNQKLSIYTVLKAMDVKPGDKLYLVVRPQSAGISWQLDLSATQIFVYRV